MKKKHFIYFMAIAMMAATIFVGCKKDDPEPDPTVLVSSITISPETDVAVSVGATVPLSASVLPANAANKTVAWSSLHPNIATVDATSGLVTGVAEGEATIRATAADGSGVTADKTIIVSADAPDIPEMTMVTAKGTVEFSLQGSGEAMIYWGDGTSETVQLITLIDNWEDYDQTVFTHSYSNATAHTITIVGKDITYLECPNNELTALDVSENIAMKDLMCEQNQLTALNVSENTLAYLRCGYNQITALDVSKSTAMWYLECYNNQLMELDVTKNTAMAWLQCYDNQLTALDVSKNTALTYLRCNGNQLTALDVSKNTALGTLWCYDNQLTALDMSKNTTLRDLRCYNNRLTDLDVTKNTMLTELICDDNPITALDVSNNIALDFLSFERNQLTALDVSNNTALTSLFCNNNQLTVLDVSNNTALWNLYCNDNLFTAAVLNALFGTLHSNTVYYPWGGEAQKRIFIGGNPGTGTCDKTIAESKGWTVNSD